jgi:hypothetical protein
VYNFYIFGAPSTITLDGISTAVVPLYNQPNLKQGQNGVEVAFTIYGIVLYVKAHLPGPKEVMIILLFFQVLAP